ncbi:MAG: redoxin domain-containing protein [Pyrinomonadaceae bacterium]|nr:redoxin domain-containing protein [Phycisphaerales bacterium]
MKIGKLVVASLTLALAAGAAFGQTDIAREGSGQARSAADKLELTAVPAAFWSSLSDWSNGEALTAESTKGKVVLIGTWWSAYKTSFSALSQMQKLSDKYGKDGLIVVGVHHNGGWDGAKKVMDDNKAKFLFAHDTGNKLRETLKSDQDPDFYVIDRAGNFRYVDILTSSVDKAVEMAVKESASDAAAAPKQLAAAAAKASIDANKTRTIASDLKPGAVLDVPFTMPEASEFKSVKWPEVNKGQLSATDVQGSALPVGFKVGSWITKEPNTSGRVIVLDFWATWCGPCKAAMPMLDELYKDNKQNLVLIGISDESEQKVSDFLSSHKHAYSQAVDTKRTVMDALKVTGIPHTVVMSTDGIVRWQGNPHDPKFQAAVTAVIANDPGVKARQAAEAAFLKAKGG